MEESQKGATSTVEKKKPRASADIDEFGNDFMTSWKMAAEENDDLDFTKSSSRGQKKVFNFGKLDDFEFGDDFNKISSFKMDIEFSSPEGVTETPREKFKGESTSSKTSSKQDAFSFNFDFNELESFGLESNLLKVTEGSDSKGKVTDVSIRNEVKFGSEGVSDPDKINLDSKKLAESNKVVKLDCSSGETPQFLEKKTTVARINDAKGNENCGQTKQFRLTDLNGLCIKSGPEDDKRKKQSELTSSGKPSAKAIPQTLIKYSNKSVSETSDESLSSVGHGAFEKTARTVSRACSSITHVPNFECSSKTCIEKSDFSDRPNTHLELGSQVAGGNIIENQSQEKQDREDTQLPAVSQVTDISSLMVPGTKDGAVHQVLQPPISVLNIASTFEKQQETKGAKGLQASFKGTVLQAKSSFKPEVTRFTRPLSLPKALCDLPGPKIEKFLSCPDKNSNSKEIMLSFGTTQSSTVVARKQSSVDLPSDVIPEKNLRVPVQSFITPKEGSSCSIKQAVISKDGGLTNKTSNMSEKHESSANLDKKILKTKRMFSGLKESKNKMVCSGKQESSSTGSSNLRSEIASVSTPASTADGKKYISLSPTLKRKSIEVPSMESLFGSPFKRLTGSAIHGEEPIEVTFTCDPKENKNPQVPGTSTVEPSSNDSSLVLESSLVAIPIAKSLTEEEGLAKSNKYYKKAESYATELDNCCSMLKKKNEEARDLLVHAIINSNSLLLLNHPIYNEKISFWRCSLKTIISVLLFFC